LVRIPYTPDLTRAGILYGCRSLALGLVRANNLHLELLRNLSAEIVAELSLRRYLTQEHISFKLLEAEPFSQPERSEIILGGRPCHVINTSITRRSHLRSIANNSEALLDAPACVPEAALTSEKWRYQDLLIFTFTLAAPNLATQVSNSSQADSGSDHLIYILPVAWQNVGLRGIISNLAIQNSSDELVTLELGGRAANRIYMTQAVHLLPRQSVTVVADFTSLSYLTTRQALNTVISVYNPQLNRTLRITPNRWSNLWVDGIGVILAGYFEVGEFRRFARRLRPSDRTLESYNSKSPSLSLMLKDLLPLPQLVAWLRTIQVSS
jgi:hypothetical protein